MSRRRKRGQRPRPQTKNAASVAQREAEEEEATEDEHDASDDELVEEVAEVRGRTKPVELETGLPERHQRYGWWSLAIFVAAGLGLEALHGFKLGMYLDVGQETRRLLWTLAHAHGTLLALVNIAFASALNNLSGWTAQRRSLASVGVLSGSLLLPVGFFLGGLSSQGGDPGLGVILVPVGGVMLLLGVVITATATLSTR